MLMCFGCEKEKECGDCFTPPDIFHFMLMDKESGENLFAKGSFTIEEIKVLDADGKKVEFEFITENDANVIRVGSIGWKTEVVNLHFFASEEELFDLYVDAERCSENCCSFTRYHEKKINNADFYFDSDFDVYRILID